MTLLIVAALAEEVAHVPADVEVLVTGVGKAAAAAGLARRLATGRAPSTVVNVGTAGAVRPGVPGIVEAEAVTQHDFPYAAIEQLTGRPAARGYALGGGRPPVPMAATVDAGVVVATGDTFVADAGLAAALAATGVHLVDMEAYGYAVTCAEFEIPFRCVKAVSDSADEEAGASWVELIDGCARGLGDWVRCHISGS